MGDSFQKRQREQKKRAKLRDKAARKQDRKENPDAEEIVDPRVLIDELVRDEGGDETPADPDAASPDA